MIKFFLRQFFLLSCLMCFIAGLLYLYSPRPPLLQGISYGKAILDRNGKLMRMTLSCDDKYRLFVPLDAINPYAITATLFYEDRNFYDHIGVNFFAMMRACWNNLVGKRKMGASTITMQVARLTLNLDSSHLRGKLRQIFRAFLLERHYSKSEILQAYFNLAPYGANIEGIEAAARIYFNSPASHLTESECIALASVPQNPVLRYPINGKDFEVARKRLWHALKKTGEPAPLAVHSPASLPFATPHLSMEIAHSSLEGTIQTTIDPQLQKLLESKIHNFIERYRNFGVNNAAAILVEGKNLEVLGLAGSASFFNNSIDGQIDGTNIRRSPGSTLKPFIYALALEQGLIHPLSILADTPKSFGGYDPQNFDQGFMGPVSAAVALRNSRNLPAISLSGQLANEGLFGFLRNAGVNFPEDADYYGLSIVLGGAEMSMRELAALYALLLNQGYLYPIQNLRKTQKFQPKRILSREASWLVLKMLERENDFVMSQGKKIPLLYKTGTSNGFRDAWTCGIIGQYILIVWLGNFDNTSNPFFVGAKTALPLFEEIAVGLAMKKTLQNALEFTENLNVEEVEICATTGDFELEHCPQKNKAWIIPGISPVKSRNIIRPVLIDRATGLRACKPDPERTDEIWLEFWPTEMVKIFKQAGINKNSPPEWLAECGTDKYLYQSRKPEIVLPKKNVIYHRRMGDEIFNLPLKASADSEIKTVYWYADNEFLGFCAPGETIFWQTSKSGTAHIKVVDDRGKITTQKCILETVP